MRELTVSERRQRKLSSLLYSTTILTQRVLHWTRVRKEGRKAAAKKPSSPRRALYAAAAAAAWPPKRRTLPPPPLLEWLGNASAERRIASQSESDSIQRVSRGSSSVLRAQQTAFGASSLLEERERERESRHYRTHTHMWQSKLDEGRRWGRWIEKRPRQAG